MVVCKRTPSLGTEVIDPRRKDADKRLQRHKGVES